MDGVARLASEPVALHTLIGLDVSDDRFDDLGPLEQAALMTVQALALAPVNHLDGCHFGIDAPVAQIDDGRVRLRGSRQILQYNDGLFQFGVQRVAIVGIAREAAYTDDQSLLLGGRRADFDAKLVGLAGLAFGNAFHFRRMQRV